MIRTPEDLDSRWRAHQAEPANQRRQAQRLRNAEDVHGALRRELGTGRAGDVGHQVLVGRLLVDGILRRAERAGWPSGWREHHAR
jgi:hypothetical protein